MTSDDNKFILHSAFIIIETVEVHCSKSARQRSKTYKCVNSCTFERRILYYVVIFIDRDLNNNIMMKNV